jgi:5-methylcytosine-specific restriction enzyme subunit McrC
MPAPAPITLFEYETVVFDWTDRDLAALDRLNRGFGSDLLYLSATQAGRRVLRATQHVGVFRFGGRTVEVLPKLYQAGTAGDRRDTATGNLLAMLAYAAGTPPLEHGHAPLRTRASNWLEALTRLFAAHLRDLWQYRVYRAYRALDDDLPTLKGKWRLAEQLRHPAQLQSFAIHYDEFTVDNPQNRVLRLAVERLWGVTQSRENRALLGQLREWMAEVAVAPEAQVMEARRLPLTRLNQHYEPVLNLAWLLLDRRTLHLVSGDAASYALVLDMSSLFEGFLCGLIRKHRSEVLPPALQGCELLDQARSETRYLARRAGLGDRGHVFRLKPDLLLRAEGRVPLLLDAKYKLLNAQERTLDAAQPDFYQMYAYAHRFHCPHVLLVYPQTADMEAPLRERFVLHDADATVDVCTVDLRPDMARPDARRTMAGRLRDLFTLATPAKEPEHG